MRSTERNKKTNQIPNAIGNAATDNKGNYFNISNKSTIYSNDILAQQLTPLLDRKKNYNPYKVIDSSNKNNNDYETTKPISKDKQIQSSKKPSKKNNKNNDKPNELIEKLSNRTVYKTTSNSSKNIKKLFENSLGISNKNNTTEKKHKKINSKIKDLSIAGNEYAANSFPKVYAKSFIGKKQQNRQVNTSPRLNSINSKSNNNIKVNDVIPTKKQLNNSKSNKTVKYYSLNSKSNKKLTIPKPTTNKKQYDDNNNNNDDKLLNSSLEKENENNITSILYLLTKINHFLGDSFQKFIDFFPLHSIDNNNVLIKRNEDITGNDLLHLVNNNKKILNWNLAKSELFFDMNIIYNNIKELKDRIDHYQSSNDNNKPIGIKIIDKDNESRVNQYKEYFDLCYTSFYDISEMLKAQIKDISNDSSKINDSDIVINNNVDDLNNENKNQHSEKRYAQQKNEDILIDKQANNEYKPNSNKNNNQIGNVNIISSVTHSNINVNVNVNLTNNSNKNNNIMKKKYKRRKSNQPAKKIISKRKFKNEIGEEDVVNTQCNLDSDLSLGNDQGGKINCPKANLYNVQKPKEENMKYKVYTSNSDFESSERDEKSVSKIVIGEIESYKDIIEQDKIAAFKHMRSKSSFNLQNKKKREKNFNDYCILEDERQISDLDEEIWDDELEQEEINDEFNNEFEGKSKRHLHLLPYHISKISFCKIFDELHGNVKVVEDYQDINLPMASKRKSLTKFRTKSKTFYINDKQGLEPQKNKDCVIF